MAVREAGPDDLPEIRAMIGELAEYEDLAHEVVGTEEGLARALFGPDPVARVSLAVADDGSVAGQALWYRTFSTFLCAEGIWLEDLYVRPAHRRQGHARALLNHLKGLSPGRVEWEVLDWNEPAIDFYRSLGAQARGGWTAFRWV
jgi:GNAT superfamily N-acetyltransferase